MSDMKQLEYHQVKNFCGYMEVTPVIFDQITPFLHRDQGKMQELLRDQPVSPSKPKWVTELPEGEGAPSVEWSGYIIIKGKE